jgi:Carboxylesterase family
MVWILKKGARNHFALSLSGFLELSFACPLSYSLSLSSPQVFDHEAEDGARGFGAFHGSELPFVFQTQPDGFIFPGYFTAAEHHLSDEVSAAWASFASHTDRPPRTDWPEFTAAGEEELVLSLRPHVQHQHKRELCEFWEEVYPRMELKFTVGEDEMRHESLVSVVVNQYLFRMLLYVSRLTAWTLTAACVSFVTMLLLSCYTCCCRKVSSSSSSSAASGSGQRNCRAAQQNNSQTAKRKKTQ